jgi:hypothetical protein
MTSTLRRTVRALMFCAHYFYPFYSFGPRRYGTSRYGSWYVTRILTVLPSYGSSAVYQDATLHTYIHTHNMTYIHIHIYLL